MHTLLRVVHLERTQEEQFLDFLERDRVLHIFTIYDLRHLREKTEAWLAYRNEEISGYLFEYDKRIIHTHGDAESVAELLRFASLDEPVLIIEPHHLATVEKFFKPVEPTDPSSKGKITTYLVMKATADSFQPKIKHGIKKLRTEDLDEVSRSLGDECRKKVENALQMGVAFASYQDETVASLATVSELVGDLALIRGVYTVPSLRGKGLATSACSASVAELIRLGKQAVLWVSSDNIPARRIYEKIGFRETGHVLLGFKAKRL